MTETAQPLLTWGALGTVGGMAVAVSAVVTVVLAILGRTIQRLSEEDKRGLTLEEVDELAKMYHSHNRATSLIALVVGLLASAFFVAGYILVENHSLSDSRIILLIVVNSFAVLAAAIAVNPFLKGLQDILAAAPQAKATKAITQSQVLFSPAFEIDKVQGDEIAKALEKVRPDERREFFRSWF